MTNTNRNAAITLIDSGLRKRVYQIYLNKHKYTWNTKYKNTTIKDCRIHRCPSNVCTFL